MAKRRQQEIELEAALHGVKLKGVAPRPARPGAMDLDRQLEAGRIKGYRIRTGVRRQSAKPRK